MGSYVYPGFPAMNRCSWFKFPVHAFLLSVNPTLAMKSQFPVEDHQTTLRRQIVLTKKTKRCRVARYLKRRSNTRNDIYFPSRYVGKRKTNNKQTSKQTINIVGETEYQRFVRTATTTTIKKITQHRFAT